MTRQEYFNRLKEQLKTLPVNEQEEALEYYRGFFDDAGDDQKAMDELGSPEDLAKEINSKFAGVPQKAEKNESCEGKTNSYPKDSIRAVDINVGGAEVVLVEGEDYRVDYRNLEAEDLRVSVSPFGTFTVENSTKLKNFAFKKHGTDKNPIGVTYPRILIRIPNNVDLDLIRIRVAAGKLKIKELNLKSARTYLDVGAGQLEAGKIFGGTVDLRCGMGNLIFNGTITGLSKVDCGMGNIKMNLEGNPEDYSFGVKVGLGSVKFNDIKKSGIENYINENKKDNHFSINCGMGNVDILIK